MEKQESRQLGRQEVLDWFDKHFELWQKDPMNYHLYIFRRDFHKQIEDWGLKWRGGWNELERGGKQ